MVRGDGGVVGLIEIFVVLWCWMIFGLEVVRLIVEFEVFLDIDEEMKFGFIKYYEEVKSI